LPALITRAVTRPNPCCSVDDDSWWVTVGIDDRGRSGLTELDRPP
jgi:hypothetical protein